MRTEITDKYLKKQKKTPATRRSQRKKEKAAAARAVKRKAIEEKISARGSLDTVQERAKKLKVAMLFSNPKGNSKALEEENETFNTLEKLALSQTLKLHDSKSPPLPSVLDQSTLEKFESIQRLGSPTPPLPTVATECASVVSSIGPSISQVEIPSLHTSVDTYADLHPITSLLVETWTWWKTRKRLSWFWGVFSATWEA